VTPSAPTKDFAAGPWVAIPLGNGGEGALRRDDSFFYRPCSGSLGAAVGLGALASGIGGGRRRGRLFRRRRPRCAASCAARG